MNYVIGIDGGATKTTIAIADLGGNILVQGSGGPGSLTHANTNDLRKTVFSVLSEISDKLPKDAVLSAVCYGAAGIDTSKDQKFARSLLESWFPDVLHDKLLAVNDVVSGRRSNSDAPYGFALVAGTGSNAYGVNKDGDEAFAGGLGWLLADQGSGFDIGTAALKAAAKDGDGRAKTVLGDLVKKKLGVTSMRETLGRFYKKDLDKAFIASFAPLVDTAADRGDESAVQILQNAADELVLHVNALVERLNMHGTDADLVMIGSILNKSNHVKQHFSSSLHKLFPDIAPVEADNDPVIGAVQLALDSLT